MNLLALVQQASMEMGLASPTSVVSNTNNDVVQMLALVNAVGYELQREHQWQALTKEYRFTTQYLSTTGTWTTAAATVTGIPTTAALAASTWMASGTGIPSDTYISSVDSATQVTLTQTPTAAGTGATIYFAQTKYAYPGDFDRLVDRTNWDKSKHWENLGPETGQQWQWLKSGFISTGPRVRFRPMGNYFQIWPMLTSNEYMGFEYVSNKWVFSTSGSQYATDKTAFTADTDTSVFADRLMTLGLKKKYFEAKGFDTSAIERDYQTQLSIAKANDAGSPTLSFAPRMAEVLITSQNIPDSGYGS